MGVYIPSMEMPTVCIQGDWHGKCPMDRTWCAQRFAPSGYTMGKAFNDQHGKIPSWCPLRPLPEKHGRLIDASVLFEELEKMRQEEREINGEKSIYYVMASMMMAMVAAQDTIVEAEGD